MDRKSAPIFLTGFSGTGKTTVGQALAFKMDRPVFDLDSEIEILGGAKIDTLMESKGIENFRQLESQILNSLALTQGSVISLGGGALMNKVSQERVRQSGFVVYLESSFERIRKNLTSLKGRPLLKGATDAELEKLFLERQPGYETATTRVVMDDLTIQESCDKIYEEYKKWQRLLA